MTTKNYKPRKRVIIIKMTHSNKAIAMQYRIKTKIPFLSRWKTVAWLDWDDRKQTPAQTVAWLKLSRRLEKDAKRRMQKDEKLYKNVVI